MMSLACYLCGFNDAVFDKMVSGLVTVVLVSDIIIGVKLPAADMHNTCR